MFEKFRNDFKMCKSTVRIAPGTLYELTSLTIARRWKKLQTHLSFSISRLFLILLLFYNFYHATFSIQLYGAAEPRAPYQVNSDDE